MEEVIKNLETLERYNELNFKVASVGKEYFGEELAESSKNEFYQMKEDLDRWSESYDDIIKGTTRLFIGVVGTFKTGKSTFINSLLGDKLLEIDAKPATSKVSFIIYGEDRQIFKCMKNSEVKEISYEEYLEQSNHREDLLKIADSEAVDHFEIFYPAPILKNFIIADTPGFSSISSEDDEITKKWLDKFDLLLWVFSPTKGTIDEEQSRILSSIKDKKIIGVINKIDNVPPGNRKKIIQSVAEKHDFYRLIEYSAKNVLEENKILEFNKKKLYEQLTEVERLFESNLDFTLSLNSNELVLQSENGILKSAPDLQRKNFDFRSYYAILVKEMEDLRRSLIKIKRPQFESNLSQRVKEENSSWKNFSNKLKKRKDEDKKELKKIEEDFTEYKKKLCLHANTHYHSYRKILFDTIYDHIFSIKKIEGGLFSANQFYIVRKDLPQNVVKELQNLILKYYAQYSSDLLDNLKNFLSTYDIGINSYEYEIGLIRSAEEKLVSSSINSLLAMLDFFTTIKTDGKISEYKKMLLIRIDYVISDEEHSYFVGDIIDTIINKAYDFCTSFCNERIDICEQLCKYIEEQVK